jgi:DNA transposition AAA+ family ATPase
VIVIQAHKYFTAKEVFREIAYKCGIEPRGTIHTLMLGIVEKLKGTRRLIIIDEAEHLNANTLDEIRQLNDRAGVGVLYVGTEKFKSKITTLRGDYGYIVNRIKVPATLAPITVSDVKMLVETVIESPSEAVVNAFAKEAMGDVRLLENLVFKAIVAARHSGVSVNSTEFVKIIHDVADILLERGVAA